MATDNASSLQIPPSREHVLYKCTAENLLGYDDIMYTVLRQPSKYRVKRLTRIFFLLLQSVTSRLKHLKIFTY